MSVLLLAVILCATHFVQGQSTCTTPSNRPGTCIIVDNCPALYALIKKTNRNQQDIDLLRKSHCGYQGNTPVVCCESQPPPNNRCYAADGQIGDCVDLHSCPSIMSMLQNTPIPNETYQFLQNSKCQGSAEYNVCCTSTVPTLAPPTQTAKPGKKKKCEATTALPDPSTECCGREASSDDRITGGNATALDQYPWLALIEYTKGTQIRLLCGGVLISGQYVLTAGHCVLGDILNLATPVNVRLGEYDTSTVVDTKVVPGGGTDTSAPIVVIPIQETIPHPEYNPKSPLRRHDIAIIRMASIAPYTEFVRPICLPLNDVTAAPPEEFKLYAAGWGAVDEFISNSKVKLHVDLPFKNMQECQAAYNVPRRSIQLWERQLCAGGEKGKDSCKGDSGGPLMYENGRVFEVIGIVSFGTTPCGLQDVPGVYTKVIQYAPWIRSNIKP